MILAIASTVFSLVTIMYPMSTLMDDLVDTTPMFKFFNLVYIMVAEMSTASVWVYYLRHEWFITSIVLVSCHVAMTSVYIALLGRKYIVKE